MEISIVPTEHVESVWPVIEKYMEGAAVYTYGRFTAGDIKHELLHTPNRQLWIAFDGAHIYGAVVTQIIVYPRMRALVMHFIGGDEGLKWKAPMLEMLRRFARDNECSVVEAIGRPGWAKIFGSDGLQKRSIFFEIPVE